MNIVTGREIQYKTTPQAERGAKASLYYTKYPITLV
jgi:hypothetical protein